MYINPFLFGVFVTLFVEMAVVIAVMIFSDVRTSVRNKNKGGKYNG
jgi:hypothetical protein